MEHLIKWLYLTMQFYCSTDQLLNSIFFIIYVSTLGPSNSTPGIHSKINKNMYQQQQKQSLWYVFKWFLFLLTQEGGKRTILKYNRTSTLFLRFIREVNNLRRITDFLNCSVFYLFTRSLHEKTENYYNTPEIGKQIHFIWMHHDQFNLILIQSSFLSEEAHNFLAI